MPPATRRSRPEVAGEHPQSPKRARTDAPPDSEGHGTMQRLGTRVEVTAEQITIDARFAASQNEVVCATAAVARMQAAAALAKLKHASNITVETHTCGTPECAVEVHMIITVRGTARNEFGVLATYEAATDAQRSGGHLRLPDRVDEPAWLLLDVLGMELSPKPYEHVAFQPHVCVKHVRIAHFLSLRCAVKRAETAAAQAIRRFVDVRFRRHRLAKHHRDKAVLLREAIRLMPAHLQVSLGMELGSSNLLHHTLPPTLLASLLAHVRSLHGDQARLDFEGLDISGLQRLAREMVSMPSLQELRMGSKASIMGHGLFDIGEPAEALCQILAHTPALSVLCLQMRHADNLKLDFPASLQELDLSGSVLTEYMGKARPRCELIIGLCSVLSNLSSLVRLQKVLLPHDEHCEELVRAPAWDEVVPKEWADRERSAVVAFVGHEMPATVSD